MLELRILAHDPIRKYENIVTLLGLAWETGLFQTIRKWPVLIMERATRGTLADLFDSAAVGNPVAPYILVLDVILRG